MQRKRCNATNAMKPPMWQANLWTIVGTVPLAFSGHGLFEKIMPPQSRGHGSRHRSGGQGV